jgi:hypothetical protein
LGQPQAQLLEQPPFRIEAAAGLKPVIQGLGHLQEVDQVGRGTGAAIGFLGELQPLGYLDGQGLIERLQTAIAAEGEDGFGVSMKVENGTEVAE